MKYSEEIQIVCNKIFSVMNILEVAISNESNYRREIVIDQQQRTALPLTAFAKKHKHWPGAAGYSEVY